MRRHTMVYHGFETPERYNQSKVQNTGSTTIETMLVNRLVKAEQLKCKVTFKTRLIQKRILCYPGGYQDQLK